MVAWSPAGRVTVASWVASGPDRYWASLPVQATVGLLPALRPNVLTFTLNGFGFFTLMIRSTLVAGYSLPEKFASTISSSCSVPASTLAEPDPKTVIAAQAPPAVSRTAPAAPIAVYLRD